MDKNDPAVVYDLEKDYGFGGYIDRRTMPRKMKVDIDVRDPNNKHGRSMWIYWGSDKSLIKAIKKAKRMLKEQTDWEVRFLNSSDYTIISQMPVTELLRIA